MAANIQSHIEVHPDVCGGKPCVTGTRIRVWDVHVWHELYGWSVVDIIAQFPQLTLADVYAALAYYHDHREEIDAEIQRDHQFAEQMQSTAGPTKFSKLLEQSELNAPVSS